MFYGNQLPDVLDALYGRSASSPVGDVLRGPTPWFQNPMSGVGDVRRALGGQGFTGLTYEQVPFGRDYPATEINKIVGAIGPAGGFKPSATLQSTTQPKY